MNTNAIRQQIKEAINHEKQTGTLANIIKNYASLAGANPDQKQISDLVAFITDYIQDVPALLETAQNESTKAGIESDLMPMLSVMEGYFLDPNDLIPDHMGLIGLMDDAYLAHTLLQSVSETYQTKTGAPLISINMAPANQFVRQLIGEPVASQLDAAVISTLQIQAIQGSLQQLMAYGMNSNMMWTDPVWGNTSIDEVVNARLGAMGVG